MQNKIHFYTGLFFSTFLVVLVCVVFFMTNVSPSGLAKSYYDVYADFGNIGSLKEGDDVRIAGVKIGYVDDISLTDDLAHARVRVHISEDYQNIPKEAGFSIATSGLIGKQYIRIRPEFALFGEGVLEDGSKAENTSSALVVEDIVNRFIEKAVSE